MSSPNAYQEPPWWRSEGDQECRHCMRRMSYEFELHCASCDEPICPMCAVRVSKRYEVFCPDCPPDDGHDEVV